MPHTADIVRNELIGVWVPTHNRVPRARPWPRLVLLGNIGYYEDGDYPAIYSVEHFRYQLIAPTVFEITASHQEYLNDKMNGTNIDDSWILPRYYDISLHQLGQDQYVDIRLCPGPPTLTQYLKTTEKVTLDYRSNWRLTR